MRPPYASLVRGRKIIEIAMTMATATPWSPRQGSQWLLGIAVAVLVGAAWSTAAWACNIRPYPESFPVDATLAGSLPNPAALSLVSASLERDAVAPPENGDCGVLDVLTLQFAQADGSGWPADLGVRLAVVRGAPPQTFTLPSYPLLTTQGQLCFAGGHADSQHTIDFTLRAVAVNAGGVESAPIEIPVATPVQRGCECGIGGGARYPHLVEVAGLVLCGLAAARARRRR
jgi:hypothetical protein